MQIIEIIIASIIVIFSMTSRYFFPSLDENENFERFLKPSLYRNQSPSKIVIKELIKRSIKFHNDQPTRFTSNCHGAEYFSSLSTV